MSEEIFFVFLTFVVLFVAEFIVRVFGHLFGLYAIVPEKEARVYVLFGNVVGVITEPGLHFLWFKLGWPALFVNYLGQCYKRTMTLDQEYLRSTPVNSEEGAPMGIGVWYEMFINDPVAHVFKNADPRGSLRANVGNATVRCLSNMPLSSMLEDRHPMSVTVRNEVSPLSAEWGYQVGSIYVRKVHFRDHQMIRQIEEKVVNRLRQVTSAIRQDGTNQVNVIMSAAEKEAAVEFAKAAAMRPQIVGKALSEISRDQEVSESLFTVLETQRILNGAGNVSLIPKRSREDLLTQFELSSSDGASTPTPPRTTKAPSAKRPS